MARRNTTTSTSSPRLKLDEEAPAGYQTVDNDTTTRLRTRHQN